MGVLKVARQQNPNLSLKPLDSRSLATLSKLAEDHVEVRRLFQLHEARWYVKTHGALEAKDSWFIRACFTHARILTHQNKGLKGKALVEESERAMNVILQGIQIAKESKRYSHLVYNGSVCFWQAARPLMRRDRWQHVHTQLGQVLAAVEDLAGHIQWKATISAAMAQCSAAMGKLDECNKHAAAAMAFNIQGDNSKDLMRAMHTLKVHENEGNPKAKVADPKDVSPELLADLTVQRVLSKFLSGPAAKAAIEVAYKKLDPDPESSEAAVPLLQVARLGFASAVNGDVEYGAALGQRAMGGMDPRARAWGEFVSAHVSLEGALPQAGKGSCKVTKGDVSKLCSVLEELQTCLQAFTGSQDVAGIHATCRDIWNTGLPLLQHNLRQRVKAAFVAASSALVGCSSPLHDLRTRFHIELAKCNMDEDQMNSALEDAEHANALDYAVPSDKEAQFRLQRPWDRHLQPLLATLRVRHSAAHEAPVLPQEQAALFTQRARECRHPATCSDYLHKAIKALQQMSMLQPIYTEPESNDETETLHVDSMNQDERFAAARELTALWACVVKAAWGLHLHDIVLLAAPHVAWFDWKPATDHEMALLQSECSYYEADASVLALVKQGQFVQKAPPESETETVSESGIRTPAKSVAQLQHNAQERLLWGMQQAVACDVPWAVSNGAVYCWNAHLPAIRRGRYAQVGEVLLQAANLLVAVDTQLIPHKLLRNLTVAAMKAAMHRALLGMLPEGTQAANLCLRECEEMHAAAVAAQAEGDSVLGMSEADQECLKAALALAEASICKLSTVPCQDLMEMVVQLQLCLGVPATTLSTTLPEQRLVAQVLQSIGEINAGSRPFKEAKAVVTQSIDVLRGDSSSDAELWVKLARCALGCSCLSQAIVAARTALGDSTSTPHALALAAVQPLKRTNKYTRFWNSCAAIVCSQATIASLSPPTQSLPAQMEILQQSLWYSAAGAALACSLSRTDAATAAAQCALNAAYAGAEFTALRAALTEPLQHICATLNRLSSNSGKGIDVALHSRLTAVCCACLLSAGHTADAAAAAQEWQKPPAHPSHAHVWAWLIEVTRVHGAPVEDVMNKLGMYTCAAQVPQWVARSAAASGSQAQQQALDLACRMAGKDPLLSAQVRVQYSEWLLTCRGAIQPHNGDILEHLSQALVCLSTCHALGTRQQFTLTAQASKHSSQSSRNSPRPTSGRTGTSGRKVSAQSVVAHSEAIIEGVQGARRLDEAIRVCVLWSLVAEDSATRLQWLLHGATCAAKMAAAGFAAILREDAQAATDSTRPSTRESDLRVASNHADTGSGDVGKSAQEDEKQPFAAPHTLRDWLLFSISATQMETILKEAAQHKDSTVQPLNNSAERKGVQSTPCQSADATRTMTRAGSTPSCCDSFTVDTLHCVDRTVIWLKALREELQQHACAAQCLPVMWLQVLLRARVSGSDGACVMLSELSNWLQKLGLVYQAQKCQMLVGESSVNILRSLAAQVSKHAQVNNAVDVQAVAHKGARARTAVVLKAAVTSIVGSTPPGLVASDSMVCEDPILRIVSDRVKTEDSKEQDSNQHSAAVAVAAQAARSHATTSATMTPRTRHQLLPTQHQHLLLQQATTLIESNTGDINHAFGLLQLAVTHADARGDVDTQARCLLQLSRIQGLTGEPEQAVILAQAAQQATRDTYVWLQAVIQYSRQRLLAGGGQGDAMLSVQLALTSVKREAMAYSPPPAAMLACMISLYLEMAALHGAAHAEALRCGQTGKFAQTEQLACLQQALSTAGTYGTTIVHSECTLALCDALEAHFNPSKAPLTQMDPRPHLRHLLTLLSETEQKLTAMAPVAAPMDSPVEVLHPLRAMHARVQARLTRTHEAHAMADIKLADQDQLRIRGSFPLIQPSREAATEIDASNGSAQPDKLAVPPTVVEHFLDSTEQAALEEQGGGAMAEPPHELYAASYACSAAALCGIGTVAVDCALVRGAVPILMAERAAIEGRLLRAELHPCADSGSCAEVAEDNEGVTVNGGATRASSTHAPVKLDGSGFEEAQAALDGALSAAVRMHDWPRAVHAAEGLLHLSSLPVSTQSPKVRTEAEVLVLWQSCRAMLADSMALTAHAPQYHTARVLQRLLQLRQHPVNSDCEPWCSDQEPTDALHPDNQSLQEDPSISTVACTDGTSPVEGVSESAGSQDARGRQSNFINNRAAAMILQPAYALLSSFPEHVSTVILDFDSTSSTVHACSLRKASDGAQPGLSSEYCHASIDADALEAVVKRVQCWEQALVASMHGSQEAAVPDEGTERSNKDATVELDGREPREPQREQCDVVAHDHVDCKADAEAVSDDKHSQSDDPAFDLRKQWLWVVTAMEKLLHPIAQVFEHAVSPPAASSAPVVDKTKKGGAAVSANRDAATVLLCVGGDIAQLPLEALSALQSAGAVCRDRGMHFAAARAELACGGTPAADSSSMAPINLAKAAYGVSAELQEQFCSTVQQLHGPEWQGDVYRPDRTIAQEHHLVTVTEHDTVLSATTEDYCTTVHKSTVCCMDSTRLLVILDRLKNVMEAGGVAGDTAPAELETHCGSRRVQVLDRKHEMEFEARMCMLLQRGVSSCVANRWPIPSDVGFGTLACALKEQDTELAVAVRKAGDALGEAEPWQKYAIVVYGVPTVMVKTGCETTPKGKKK